MKIGLLKIRINKKEFFRIFCFYLIWYIFLVLICINTSEKYIGAVLIAVPVSLATAIINCLEIKIINKKDTHQSIYMHMV